MISWGNGYVTDIEYSDGFYPHQGPAQMHLVATMTGLEAPSHEAPFAYCELGCGKGKTSLVLAAINPLAEFHAVDFNPAHIAFASAQAREAELANLTFHEFGFDELTGPRGAALPMFDFITMHGVWSWIAPELQDAIVRFLNAKLKPGGLLHLSYNAMPAWSDISPMQRLVKELAHSSDRSDHAVARAIDQLDRMKDAGIIPQKFHGSLKHIKEARDISLTYLAHEYINEHWRPVYFADVARALAGAKLSFVGCSNLLKNFHNLTFNEEQRKLLDEIGSPELRETLRDFCTDHRFRQDVFVRGARRMSAAKRDACLRQKTLTLMRPAPKTFEITKPDGSRWRPEADVYHAVMQALQRRPHLVEELLSLEGLPANHLVQAVELVGALVGSGLAGQYRPLDPVRAAAAAKLNGLLESNLEEVLTDGVTLAAPMAYTGITLSPANYALLLRLRRGESPSSEELASAFIRRCQDQGGHPVVNGKEIEEPLEAQKAVAADYAEKLTELPPVWQHIGLL